MRNMKSLKKILSLLIVAGMLFINVYATEDLFSLTVDYNRQTGAVSVSGTADENAKKATLMVLRPDKKVDDMEAEGANFFTSAIHADEAAITDNAFIFDSFSVLSYDPGAYTVYVSDGNEVKPYTINVATEAQALELIKNADSAAEVMKLISEYNEIYGLDTGAESLYEKISDEGKAQTALRIAEQNPSTNKELSDLFNLSNVLYKIYSGPWTAVEQLINDNSALLGIDLGAIIYAYNKTDVFKALTGKLYTNAADFNTAYLAAIAASKAPQTVISGGTSSGGGGTAYIPTTLPSDSKAEVDNTPAFLDVDNKHWAFEYVQKLYSENIINGKSAEIFAPGDLVTRAEAVKMIALTFCIEGGDEFLVTFSDVDKTHWAYSFIRDGVSNKIITGYNESVFGINDYVTKQDLSVMIYRALKSKNITLDLKTAASFSDEAQIAQYAKESVAALSGAGVVNGYNGKFMPENNATRAETAKMLAFFVE